MTTATTSKQRWLAALWPFVYTYLPPVPCRVLEIGCGPVGGFVPALHEHGYDAVGVDPAAPPGAGYHQTEFEHHETTDPVDAIVACTSLHHVDDLDEVLDRIATTLVPGGVLVVVEWAYEKFDEATARWCFDRPWHTYLDAWARRENLHSGQAIIRALQARFHTRLLTYAPYFFPDLHPTTDADEQAAADTGEIQATGIRYVGTRPATER
jgi:SAM-dependent methyltransferase